MELVIDANILVAELIRQRGRELIIHPAWKLYIAEKAWEEMGYELNKRITIIIEKKVFSSEIGHKLLDDAFTLAEMNISLIPDEFYFPYKTIALARLPRDPNDWPTVTFLL
jgi:predicted nucleic acid-binding protein